MTVGSLFAGIGGFDLAFERAGAVCSWQVEIDKHCRRVLERHFPTTERRGDVRAEGASTLPAVDLVCGGFPCQDLSVAGRREGLAGERSGLWYEFHRLLAELRPAWVCVENVPGLRSSQCGRDLAVILHGLGELGYRSAWRSLDAQHFGLAQRRTRVFVVGHLGDGAAAEILFEPTSVPGDLETGRAAGQDVAGTLGGPSARGGFKQDLDGAGAYVANAVRSSDEKRGDDFSTLIVGALQERDGKGTDSNTKPGHLVPCVKQRRAHGADDHETWGEAETAPTLNGFEVSNARSAVLIPDLAEPLIPGEGKTYTHEGNVFRLRNVFTGLRRLTPLECERLQGFPDGWTAGESDTARYRMLGNAVAVPVAEWIARRIVNLTGGDPS